LFPRANLSKSKQSAKKRLLLKLFEQGSRGALKLFELSLSFVGVTVSDFNVNKGKKSTPQIAPLI
tara:strand:+ start:28007 stop:28201 length:195 start_codon:yes stop_codon:yes gene_type:complete